MNLLRSKITAPECQSDFISRPRLIQKITGNRKANLILISAPAGYGKTTLAAQLFATLKGVPKAWYSIDQHDCEVSRFASFFVEALSQAIPALKTAGLGRRHGGDMPDIGVIADDLCFFFQEYKGAPGWLVLDNWEAIDGLDDIRAALERLIKDAGGMLKLIVNSRVKPSFKFRKLQESGKAVFISEHDLAFSLTEFSQAVKTRIKGRVDDSELEELWEFSGGWCVNVGLLLELLEHRGLEDSVNIISALAESETIFEYVEEELLRGLPPDLLDFIAKCSVLVTISADACSAVMDNDSVTESNIKLLTKSAIPHLSHTAKGSFRLHPLVRHSANRILRQKMTPEELGSLYLAVSEYHLRQGDLINAVECLLDLPDYNAVLIIIDKYWYKFLESCGIGQVERWLNRMPSEIHEKSLFVRLMSNVLSIGGNNNQIMAYLADKLNPSAYEKGDILLANSWVRYHWARLHSTHKSDYTATVKEWKKLWAKSGPFVDSALAGAELTLSCAAYMELRLKEAKFHLERCLERIPEDNHVYRLNSLDNMAIFEQMLGHTQAALDILYKNIEECRKRGITLGMADRYALISWMYLSAGKYQKGLDAAAKGAEILRYNDSYNVRTDMYLEKCKGVSSWYLGDKIGGIEHLERALELAAHSNRREVAFNAILIEYFSLDLTAPQNLVEKQDIPPAEVPSETRLLYLLKTCTQAIIEGKFDRVDDFVTEILGIAVPNNLTPWIITANFFMAILADHNGQHNSAKACLEKGLSLMGEICWDTYFLANDRILAKIFVMSVKMNLLTQISSRLISGENKVDLTGIFRQALEDRSSKPPEKIRLLNAARQYAVRGLIGTARDLTSSKSRELCAAAGDYIKALDQGSLPPLKIKTLGRFSVVAAGNEVNFIREKSKLIFQMLTLEQPRPVHEEVLMEQFWPNIDPRKSKVNLQTCVKDLRKSLDPFYEARSKSYIEYSNGHYSLALPEGSNVDVFEFKSIIGRSRLLKNDGSSFKNELEEYWRALSVYGLEFLPQQRYETFTLEFRETLQREYQENALICANLLIREKNHRRAIDLLEHGLKLDPFWADGVQKLMLAKSQVGEVLAAMRIYRDYEKRLQKELNLPPDKDLKRYFDSIIQANA